MNYRIWGILAPILLMGWVAPLLAETVRIMDVQTGVVFVFTPGGVVPESALFAVSETISAQADVATPSIGAILVDGKAIQSGDFVAASPEFSVTLTPGDGSNIGYYELALINAATLTVTDSTANTVVGGVTHDVAVTYRPSAELQTGGRYFLRVNAQNVDGASVTSNSVEFIRDNVFRFEQVYNSPNPFNPSKESTYFEAQLTKDTEITVSIYSLSGELIWKSTESGTPGYWTVAWNGRNMFGETVPNGAYIAVLVAKSGSDRRIAKLKVGVLR